MPRECVIIRRKDSKVKESNLVICQEENEKDFLRKG